MSAFETDLRLVREARSQTLEQIQQETRVPVDVLKRFEDGDLAADPTFNRVYLIALLRTYARAVGLPQADVVAAYERTLIGTYRGELHPAYDGPAPAPPAAVAEDDAPQREPADEPPPVSRRADPARPPASPVAASVPAATPSVAASPVDALRAAVPPAPAATPVASRVARPAVPGARHSYDKNWGAILGLSAAVVVALALAVYFLMFRDTPEPADDAELVARIDSAAVGAGVGEGGRRFQTPISVRVSASGDGLQSFRVSLDGDRAPRWIATGETETFTADSSLILWGEGTSGAFSDAIVELQGVRWTPPDGRPVTISRATGQRLLDSLAAPATVPADSSDF
ncbi:MAG TPA: helix-turn-helix domain-containing protein [Rubricoccaceae bacterium]